MHLTRSLVFIVCIYLFPLQECIPQGLKGRISDETNNPIPFAVIYDESTYTGTTSNADGYYELKLDEGSHSIVYKAMGYYIVRKTITPSISMVTMDVILKEQPVAVKEIVITPGKEDPAYAIMRKVIGLAPYHLNQVKEYQAEVYLKGTLQVTKIPKFISKHTSVNGKTSVLKSGDVFFEESVNQIHFHAPDHYEQKVTSIHSTFPWNNQDVNPMGIINSSLYEPEVDDFISPLSPNAFNYYSYKYLGFFDEGDQVIFKIQVTPKRNSQQLMRGIIFIVDKQWCLHSTDVSAEMFFGKLKLKTIYSPVKSNAWMPVSYQVDVDASIMGVIASYKYASSVKFKLVVLTDKERKVSSGDPETKTVEATAEQSNITAKQAKQQQDIENLLSKEDLSNRDMLKLSTLMAKESVRDTVKMKTLEIKDSHRNVTVEKGALKNDSSFWNAVRPIPLTSIESRISGGKDSLAIAHEDSIAVADSIRKIGKPKFPGKVSAFVFMGKGFWILDSTLFVKYDGLISLKKFDFNTVDGFIFRQTVSLEQKIDSSHRLRVNPGIGYAFNRQRWMWWTDIRYEYAPMRNGELSFHIGSESADYNGETGINSTINSLASLFFRRNYLKLYLQNSVFLSNRIDLANGLNLTASVGYRTARPLENHSDFSFFFQNERNYSPNIANDRQEWISRNLYNEEAYWDISLEYTPQYYYRVSGGQKHYQHSRYPTFSMRNIMAVPGIVNSTADYDLFEFGIRQRLEWGMMHSISYNLKAGYFFNQNRIFTSNDKYFNNQPLPIVLDNRTDAFRLLPFYRKSTTEHYAESHITFSTPYLLVKYLPFLANKLWSENLHVNYLTTNLQLHYWEAGYSISKIYMVGSIGVYAGFKGADFQSVGMQVSFAF
jgi:hypothetical protein